MREVKTVGILTSGGDAPGMNAAIRAVVRTALASGMNVKGIRHGYAGLLNNEIIDMDSKMVHEIARLGGTILFTARCKEFTTKEGQKAGAEILKANGIDGLIVIGGDGSFRGAQKLSELGINTIGIPGTIDLDINCTEYTIGFDTAVNTAMEAIDKVKDTSTSHERCSIIEVMGRNAGHIALWCQMANGADGILIPERDEFDEQDLIDTILRNRSKGKTHHVIINAEGVGHTDRLLKQRQVSKHVQQFLDIFSVAEHQQQETVLWQQQWAVMPLTFYTEVKQTVLSVLKMVRIPILISMKVLQWKKQSMNISSLSAV